MEQPSHEEEWRSTLTEEAVTFGFTKESGALETLDSGDGADNNLSNLSGKPEYSELPPTRITSLATDFLASMSQFEILSITADPIPEKPLGINDFDKTDPSGAGSNNISGTM